MSDGYVVVVLPTGVVMHGVNATRASPGWSQRLSAVVKREPGISEVLGGCSGSEC